MLLKWIIMENHSWNFRNDMDELFQLSVEETELQKMVQVIQGHMVITLIMKYGIPV